MTAHRTVLIKLAVLFGEMGLHRRRFFNDRVYRLAQQGYLQRPLYCTVSPHIERQAFRHAGAQPKLALSGGNFMQLNFLRCGLRPCTEFPTLHISLFVHNIL